MHDIEKASLGDSLSNQSITEFAFDVSSVQVQDRNHKPQTLKLLENVQGDVQAGQLMAIMGPSGSGKSTLLNALANRPAQAGAHVEAAITVNGQRVSDAFFRHVTAYVEQEDTLIGSLTVRETLTFAGRLSFKGRISSAVLADRVDNLITRLGLLGQSDHLVGTPIRKGISGGQKRRLSIASQLITGPRILFLDEPTSGLDSSASFEVITLLKAMARDLNVSITCHSTFRTRPMTANLVDNRSKHPSTLNSCVQPLRQATAAIARQARLLRRCWPGPSLLPRTRTSDAYICEPCRVSARTCQHRLCSRH